MNKSTDLTQILWSIYYMRRIIYVGLCWNNKRCHFSWFLDDSFQVCVSVIWSHQAFLTCNLKWLLHPKEQDEWAQVGHILTILCGPAKRTHVKPAWLTEYPRADKQHYIHFILKKLTVNFWKLILPNVYFTRNILHDSPIKDQFTPKMDNQSWFIHPHIIPKVNIL